MAVVAEAFADAQCGLLALNVEWNDEHAERRSSEDLLHEHQRLVASGERAVVARADGNVEDGFARATHTIDAFYELPYLAHAPMEPNDAVCRMGEDGILEVWAGTESPVYAQMTGSRIAGIAQDRVRIHVPDAGGSFGLHYSSGANDPASEALQIAKALEWRYPIKVQASREEGIQERSLSCHGGTPRARRSHRRWSSHRLPPANGRGTNLAQPAVCR